MREGDLVGIAVVSGVVVLLVIVAVALTAGNIVNQLFGPFPSLAGPLGAAVALLVFVFLAGKGGSLVASLLG